MALSARVASDRSAPNNSSSSVSSLAKSKANESLMSMDGLNDTLLSGPRLAPPEYSEGGRKDDREESGYTEVAVVRMDSFDDVQGREDVLVSIAKDDVIEYNDAEGTRRSMAMSESMRGRQSNI